MFNKVSDTFKNLMLSGSGMITSKLVFDDFELSGDDIHSITYKSGSSDGNSIAPGTVYIPELQAEIEASDKFFKNKEMSWYIGLSEDGESYEYVKVCKVWIKSVEKNIDTIKLTAYSKIYLFNNNYNSNLSYPATVDQVLNEISNLLRIEIDTSGISLPLTKTISEKPTGYTFRQIIGHIAGLYGCFAVPNRDDSKLLFKWYEDNNLVVNEDFDEPQIEDSDITVNMLVCNVNGNWLYSSGKAYIMKWTCMYMTSDILEQLQTKISGFTYRVGSFNLLSGNILLDPWDIVTISYNGEQYKMPAGVLEHKYDGGLSTYVQTPGDTDGESTSSSLNTAEQSTNRLIAQIVETQNVLADKIDAAELTAFEAEINNLIADKASFQQLEAVQAAITVLSANKADISDLDAVRADIEQINADKADISVLEAAMGNISNLSSAVANITTILSGQVGTGTLQAINITAENTTISEAAIKELIANRITVNDLKAGKISTDKFEISSEDGGLSFKGATAQWKDANGVVRVQIGKDAQGNFTFTLFDTTGKGVLLDSSGIHENAVPDGLIVDSMVADNANIAGKKLDIESVIKSINEDGSTLLKSSKILIDSAGQTLDIAFKTVSTKTSELDKTITSQGQSISVIEGKINQKIWESDIETALEDTEKQITTLRDQYNTVSDTLDSHTQEIADVLTKVETKADGSLVSEIESRVSSFEQNLDGFKTTVSQNYVPIDLYVEGVNDLYDFVDVLYDETESSITQLSDNIELKVEKNGVISAINQSPEKITIEAKKVDINGVVEFINNGYSTKINGDAIETGTITADKISADSLQSISAKIGGFTIGEDYIANGTEKFGKIKPEELIEQVSIDIPNGTVIKKVVMVNAIASYDYPFRFYNADTNTLLGTLSSTVNGSEVFLITANGSNSGFQLIATYKTSIPGIEITAYRGAALTYNLKIVWHKISAKGSVYLGLDGISCGETFSVNSDGNLKATSGNIAGFEIAEQTILMKSTIAYNQTVYCFLNSVGETGEHMDPAPYSIMLAANASLTDTSDAQVCTPALFITQGGELVSLYNKNYDIDLRIKNAEIYLKSGHYIRSTYPGYTNKTICGQTASGQLQIGDSSQPSSTYIYTKANSFIYFYVGTSYKAYISSSGLVNSSDERLKNHIEDIDDKYVQIADKLKPKTFKYKDDNSSKINMGFIAQDLEAIMSELDIDSESFASLEKDEEGYMGINYIQLIPILWAKVQQLSEEIKKLKSKEDEDNVNKL